VGADWPTYPAEVLGGDEATHSPFKTQNSLLAAERGTQKTKRIETDEDNNVYVRVAKDDSSSGFEAEVLAVGAVSGLVDNSLVTITTFVASADAKVSKISCSGDAPADFTVLLNTTQIDIKRSSTSDLDKEFSFEHPLKLVLNDVLDIQVKHHATGKTRSFNATIYGA
jgi:hypothetical protein